MILEINDILSIKMLSLFFEYNVCENSSWFQLVEWLFIMNMFKASCNQQIFYFGQQRASIPSLNVLDLTHKFTTSD